MNPHMGHHVHVQMPPVQRYRQVTYITQPIASLHNMTMNNILIIYDILNKVYSSQCVN